MDIISRSDAIRRGLKQYFTNSPCKNNHISYRYTSSGSCSACIRSYGAPVEELKIRAGARDNLARMVTLRVRIFDCDLDFFSKIILATVQAREPSATMRDVWKGGSGTKRDQGSGMQNFNCFGEDLQPLWQTNDKMFWSHCIQVVTPVVFQPPAEEWPEHDPK